MSLLNDVIETVDRGKTGLNHGIPLSVPRLPINIKSGRYYLVFAQSGVGKSAFVYDQFLFNTLDYVLKHNTMDVFSLFYNLEIENADIGGLLVCRWLYNKYKILIDLEHLYSAGEEGKVINSKVETLIKSKECTDYIKEFESRVAIFSSSNRALIDTSIEELLKNKVVKDEEGESKYLPSAKNTVVQVVIDHIGLLKRLKGENEYQTLVETSSMLVRKRRKYRISPVVVQQVTPQKDTYAGKDRVMPDHEDLRGGKETYQDCNVAVAIGSPYRSSIENFGGYKILDTEMNEGEGLLDRLRLVRLPKSRGTVSTNRIPCLFIGECGIYNSIELPDTINYTKYANIRKTY